MSSSKFISWHIGVQGDNDVVHFNLPFLLRQYVQFFFPGQVPSAQIFSHMIPFLSPKCMSKHFKLPSSEWPGGWPHFSNISWSKVLWFKVFEFFHWNPTLQIFASSQPQSLLQLSITSSFFAKDFECENKMNLGWLIYLHRDVTVYDEIKKIINRVISQVSCMLSLSYYRTNDRRWRSTEKIFTSGHFLA